MCVCVLKSLAKHIVVQLIPPSRFVEGLRSLFPSLAVQLETGAREGGRGGKKKFSPSLLTEVFKQITKN